MPPLDAIVVGAGMAGLTAARELRGAGASVLVLERDDQVGGRVRCGRLDGRSIDLGAHFFSDRYELVRQLVREAGLEPQVRPLAGDYLTAIRRGGRWHHVDYGRPVSVARLGAVSPLARARLGLTAVPLGRALPRMRFFDVASAAAADDGLRPARVFGADVLRYVLAPGLQAFCGYEPEDIAMPVVALASRFPLGRPLTLDGGLGQLGRALARELPLRTATAVEEVSRDGPGVRVRARGPGGEELHTARAAVIATTASAALHAWPGAPAAERELLSSTSYTQHFHLYVRTRGLLRPAGPGGRPVLMEVVPGGEGAETLSHVSFPGGDLAFVAARPAAVAAEDDDERLGALLEDEAARLHPELRDGVIARRAVRWREKVPRFPPGRARELAAFRARLRPGPVQLAGDYLCGPLMEGAAQSGVAAARLVLDHLRADG